MIALSNANTRRLAIGAAIVAALGAGYGLAKVTPPPAAPAPAAEASTGPAELVLDAGNIQASGIAVQQVQAGDFSAEIMAPANVVPAANGEAAISLAHQ
jgi:cobalt-zinc-cadmium efflux system membrane fusion protein